jgi:GNAT superfamily N-acetyltransferase
VVEVDGNPRGFGTAALAPGADLGEILMVAVDPSYQRRGLGTALIEVATAWLGDQGAITGDGRNRRRSRACAGALHLRTCRLPSPAGDAILEDALGGSRFRCTQHGAWCVDPAGGPAFAVAVPSYLKAGTPAPRRQSVS